MKVEKVLEKTGLTIPELANKLGIKKTNIYTWRTKGHEVPLKHMAVLGIDNKEEIGQRPFDIDIVEKTEAPTLSLKESLIYQLLNALEDAIRYGNDDIVWSLKNAIKALMGG